MAALALQDVQHLPYELWPFPAIGSQVWGLRGSLTAYDASYVALAALLDVPLVTLDARLARAAERSCRVRVP